MLGYQGIGLKRNLVESGSLATGKREGHTGYGLKVIGEGDKFL